jgi:phosphatidate phosphatase
MNDESEIALLTPINITRSSNEQDFENDDSTSSSAWQRTITAPATSSTSMSERNFHERNRRNNRAMMSDLPLRLPIQKTLFECFLLYSFGITVELLFRLIGPPKLGYFCNDLSISFTSKSSIVNGFELAAFVYCCSFFPILFVELYRLLKYDPEVCFSMMERGYNKISRLAIRVVVFFGYCQVAIVFTWALTSVTKFSIGRPRPYFLWICNSTYTCASNYSTEYVSPDKYECQGNALYVQEARLSFFSGHSSLSLAAATYAVLYLQARMPPKLFSRLLTPLFQFIIFASGLFVAYSRVVDHNHHPTDVLCGVIVGIIIACLVAKFVARLFDPPKEILLIKSSRSESSADESHIV